ncbi:MAG: hypothetical protein JXA44_01240 [Methanospirillaceae archaeon]|nr:hypothetical protein [Methanospirillaceae archaeon]
MLPAGVQVLAVIFWLGLLTLLYLAIYPFFKTYLPKVAVTVSFTLSFLLFGIVSWYAVYLALPVQTAVIPFLCLIGWNLWKTKGDCYRHVWDEKNWYLLFYGTFILFLLIRAFSPDINGAEKFMDHAFLASMMIDPVIPPHDPWFAGGDLRVYYYVGYWILGAAGVVTNTPSVIVFILAIPTIVALSAVNCYAVGRLLIKDLHLITLIPLLIVNPAFIALWIRGNHPSMLFWDSTRIITDTITEYPLFSFTFGDVHPHVIGICNQTLMILLLCTAVSCWKKINKKSRILLLAAITVSLGSMPVINSWDLFLYAPAVMLTGLWIAITGAGDRKEGGIRSRFTGLSCSFILQNPIVPFCILIPLAAVALYLPFYLMMDTGGLDGIGFVITPSDPVQFLLVHGFFFLIFFFSLLSVMKKKPYFLLILIPAAYFGYLSAGLAIVFLIYLIIRHDSSPDLLAIVGLSAILFCEFFYLKDHMGAEWYRMNTVFKMYLPAWLLTGIAGMVMAGSLIERSSLWSAHKTRITGSLRVLVCILFILPLLPAITDHAPYAPTLDGSAFLDTRYPDDAAGIRYLKTLPADTVIVEAEGGDYSYYGRMSSFTGLATIIGWPFHEIMWRNDDSNWYNTRLCDLRMMYENPEMAASLMQKYHATVLIIGEAERSRYAVKPPLKDFIQIFKAGSTRIYRLSA